MRRHAWIGIVAIVGVLLHAAAVLRHHALMTGLSSEQVLTADLGAICHGGGGTAVPTTDPPSEPPQQRSASDCPICMGLSVAYLSSASPTLMLPLVVAKPVAWPWSEQIAAGRVLLHSYARGPPVAA